MTAERASVLCGSASLTETQLRARAASFSPEDVRGRIVPVLDADRIGALASALAVRSLGGIPLVADDRWDSEYRAGLRALAGDDPLPGTAWATFSSGSSGSPRVILRSEQSWSASFAAVTDLLDLGIRDAVYLPAPLASSLSLFSVAHARCVGAAILLPRTHSVCPADLAHATVLHGTPHALRAVVDTIDAGAGHRLRVALVGGAHLDPALRERAAARGIRVVSYYGAAELSFVAVDADGSGFRPFPGVEASVRDGELWVRSPYLASGYLGGASGALRRDDRGWATVGDLVEGGAAVTGGGPKGALRFRGRRDGAILTAAATVVPEDVEAALRGIDGIEDAVVFGVPNTGVGSLVAALVEMTPGRQRLSVHELREQAGIRLTPSHVPRRWFWTDDLPRTTAGKPARARVRDAALNGEVERLA
ncbi:acyl-CoA synthetase (AMP-forming)/AMP-acid ligase II [Marisediminicola sp. UYEF4]|uniref:ANL family adenylate-forming protein n=1 Tax=Marisediminicola sp. UYEF4 TaxID=1756384 RepID=UPI0033947E91